MKAHSRRAAVLVCAIVLGGAAVRVAPLFHDFWLDEAWSYLLVRDGVAAPAEILTKLHTDNNHPINSLILYVLGSTIDWPAYRLPAWVAGVFCIPLAYAVMRRLGETHAFYAAALVAGSYPLVVYSTEARGYGLMLCFLLAAIEAAWRWLATRTWLSLSIFWMAVILGTLSHLTFIHGYLAIVVFTGYELRRQSAGFAVALVDFAKLHFVPLVFLQGLYWVFVQHLTVAGAAPTGLIHTLVEAMTTTLGGPSNGPLALLGVLGFLALLVQGLSRIKVRSEGWYLLFACGIVLVPLPLIGLRLMLHPESTPIFPRYFLTSITLFLLLAGFLCGELHTRGTRGRIISGVLLAFLLTGNVVHTVHFSLIGRGQYLEALRHIVGESPDAPIHVASNSDFRTRLLLSFYAQYLPQDRPIVYHFQSEGDGLKMVDWWILEFLEARRPAPRELRTIEGRFSLERSFDFYGPSGCGWAVYRRSDRPG